MAVHRFQLGRTLRRLPAAGAHSVVAVWKAIHRTTRHGTAGGRSLLRLRRRVLSVTHFKRLCLAALVFRKPITLLLQVTSDGPRVDPGLPGQRGAPVVKGVPPCLEPGAGRDSTSVDSTAGSSSQEFRPRRGGRPSPPLRSMGPGRDLGISVSNDSARMR